MSVRVNLFVVAISYLFLSRSLFVVIFGLVMVIRNSETFVKKKMAILARARFWNANPLPYAN